MPNDYRFLGKATPRKDALEIVTGKAKYIDDIRPAAMLHGKVLSTLRIIKAALTFDGALDYLLWKIKRHSGVYIEPTERQRRFPLVFAWPLLWRLYRRGAFR